MDKEKTILVVDDSKANLTLAKQALDEHYQVSLVPSGSTALRFLEKTPEIRNIIVPPKFCCALKLRLGAVRFE